MISILQTSVGVEGGPVVGQTTYRHPKLEGAIVQFIIVDNVVENCIEPQPDFTNNPIAGEIKRNNVWAIPNKLIVVYSPNCNCQ